MLLYLQSVLKSFAPFPSASYTIQYALSTGRPVYLIKAGKSRTAFVET